MAEAYMAAQIRNTYAMGTDGAARTGQAGAGWQVRRGSVGSRGSRGRRGEGGRSASGGVDGEDRGDGFVFCVNGTEKKGLEPPGGRGCGRHPRAEAQIGRLTCRNCISTVI